MSRPEVSGVGRARFLMSAPTVAGLAELELPEVAFIGRSNVGKSSLLAALMRAPDLVRTSRTPGRTQALNLFLLDEALALVDLPGYGYAKLSKTLREKLEANSRRYLSTRTALRAVILLLDARREPPMPLDRAWVSWLFEQGRAVLVVLSKMDLVPKNQRLTRVRRIETALNLPPGWTMPVSATSGEGLGPLYRRIQEVAGCAPS